ncbi:hypothetical protein [Nocardia sp. NPDC052566]|uniref:hypothetical protein n=1 Tax=Nocardia sp. NPDC052566 TaxID=3364330 RepID=UPI0037C90051
MEHGQQGAESVGAMLSSIAAALREFSEKLDDVATRVDGDRSVEARLAKLEAWAFRAEQDISDIDSRLGGAPDAGPAQETSAAHRSDAPRGGFGPQRNATVAREGFAPQRTKAVAHDSHAATAGPDATAEDGHTATATDSAANKTVAPRQSFPSARNNTARRGAATPGGPFSATGNASGPEPRPAGDHTSATRDTLPTPREPLSSALDNTTATREPFSSPADAAPAAREPFSAPADSAATPRESFTAPRNNIPAARGSLPTRAPRDAAPAPFATSLDGGGPRQPLGADTSRGTLGAAPNGAPASHSLNSGDQFATVHDSAQRDTTQLSSPARRDPLDTAARDTALNGGTRQRDTFATSPDNTTARETPTRFAASPDSTPARETPLNSTARQRDPFATSLDSTAAREASLSGGAGQRDPFATSHDTTASREAPLHNGVTRDPFATSLDSAGASATPLGSVPAPRESFSTSAENAHDSGSGFAREPFTGSRTGDPFATSLDELSTARESAARNDFTTPRQTFTSSTDAQYSGSTYQSSSPYGNSGYTGAPDFGSTQPSTSYESLVAPEPSPEHNGTALTGGSHHAYDEDRSHVDKLQAMLDELKKTAGMSIRADVFNPPAVESTALPEPERPAESRRTTGDYRLSSPPAPRLEPPTG